MTYTYKKLLKDLKAAQTGGEVLSVEKDAHIAYNYGKDGDITHTEYMQFNVLAAERLGTIHSQAISQCQGCMANWPFLIEGSNLHEVQGGYKGELVGCTRDRYIE